MRTRRRRWRLGLAAALLTVPLLTMCGGSSGDSGGGGASSTQAPAGGGATASRPATAAATTVPAPSGPTTKLAAKLQAINIISNAVTLVKPDGSELVLTVGLSTKLTVNGNTVSIGAFLPRFGNTVNVEYATGNNILVSMAAQD